MWCTIPLKVSDLPRIGTLSTLFSVFVRGDASKSSLEEALGVTHSTALICHRQHGLDERKTPEVASTRIYHLKKELAIYNTSYKCGSSNVVTCMSKRGFILRLIG